jgi:hypothetical protein
LQKTQNQFELKRKNKEERIMVEINKPSVGQPTSNMPSTQSNKSAAVSFQNQQNAIASNPKTNTIALASKPTSSNESSSMGKSNGGLNASSSLTTSDVLTNKTVTQKNNQDDTGGENGKKSSSGTISSKDTQTLASAMMDDISGSNNKLRATASEIKIALMKTGISDRAATEMLKKELVRLREKLFMLTKISTSLKNELQAIRFNAHPNVRRVNEIYGNSYAA